MFRWLQERYPIPGVRLAFVKRHKKFLGWAQTHGRKRIRGRIVISLVPFPYAAEDTLLHEYAHCLAPEPTEHQDHSPRWARAYGKLYRRWFDWGGREECFTPVESPSKRRRARRRRSRSCHRSRRS